MKMREYLVRCDRCSKELDQLKGEDIFLEVTSEIVCDSCHTEQDEELWSKDIR